MSAGGGGPVPDSVPDVSVRVTQVTQGGDLLIVPIEAEGLEKLLGAKDRNAALKKMHADAVVGSGA